MQQTCRPHSLREEDRKETAYIPSILNICVRPNHVHAGAQLPDPLRQSGGCGQKGGSLAEASGQGPRPGVSPCHEGFTLPPDISARQMTGLAVPWCEPLGVGGLAQAARGQACGDHEGQPPALSPEWLFPTHL